MLRNPPRLKYSGITAILSNPSRFDKVSLLTSTGGNIFSELLQPQFNQMQVDVRLMEDPAPFLNETKVILLLGEAAMHKYVPQTKDNTLNEMRGSPLYIGHIPAIASYFPQDAADIKHYEQEYNEQSKEYNPEDDDREDEEEGDVKRFSSTKRGNYAFWLKQDIEKCKRLLASSDRTKWPIEQEPTYKIYPSCEEVITRLAKFKDHYMLFDIETDYEEANLLCFSFAFWRDGVPWDRVIYSVPVLDYNYRWAYSSLPLIIRYLVRAIQDNILVAHNGAAFDFFVLGYKYHILVRRVWDTMLTQHRIYPDIEKSLGHCTSMWTYQTFHKDEDSRAYLTKEHMYDKLKYCGKDVFTMLLILQAQLKHARTIPGLVSSIDTAQSSILPYLICSLQGIRYSQEKVDRLKNENDRLMYQYLRIINILIGENGIAECRKAVKGKAKGFCNSNAQCCSYFHDQLGYPVVFRSSKTQKPSLGKGVLFKLALKHDNPVITFTNMYRTVMKEYGALKFHPWKDDKGMLVPYTKDEE